MIITLILTAINNISYADVLKGENAYNVFRINDYKNIKYKIDESNTNKYRNHTDAWKNAINSFEADTFGEIGFIKSEVSESKITMTSVNSSKEEWLGLSRSTISTNSNGVSNLQKSQNYLNQYTIKSFDLSKEHINEVALHELGHSFGLKHQPQEYENKTIMIPYLNVSKPSKGELKNIDKYNLIYSYSSGNDWINHWSADNIKNATIMIPYLNVSKPSKGELKNIDKYNLIYSYSSGNDWINHWSADNIKNAINYGWIDDTTYFRPNDSITRAEFVEMINRKFEISRSSGKIFFDTVDHWAKDEIDIAFTNNVCVGTSDYIFEPDRHITRQEAVKMLANYMKLSDKNHDKISRYSDYSNIVHWAIDEFEAIVERGYIIGTPEGMLMPKGNLSRAEAIVILSRI